MGKTVDDRSATAKALSKSSEVTSICLLMIVPGLIGYAIDRWLGTGFVFMVLGLLLGMGGATMQLMKLVSDNALRIEEIDLTKVKKFESEPEEDDDWNSQDDKWDPKGKDDLKDDKWD